MKTPNIPYPMPFALAILMVGALVCRAADARPQPAGTSEQLVKPVNYVLHVDWKVFKGGTNSLLLVTTEGTFKVDTTQPVAVKGGDSELPVSVSVNGDLKVLNPEQGRLQLFLGRAVPYVTRAGGSMGASSVQQRQEGLSSVFVVTFGKPILIQRDANGEVTVLVERAEP